MTRDETMIPLAEIERRILTVRGQKVMLDSGLAHLYGVPTKRLNEQVRRNVGRFPPDFMFQLSTEEASALRSQFATSNPGRGGRRYLPYAFTEHGAIMQTSLLNTRIAVQGSVQVVRAFVRLREILATHKNLTRELKELEKKYDAQFKVVFDAIQQLMAPSGKARRSIGFRRGGGQTNLSTGGQGGASGR